MRELMKHRFQCIFGVLSSYFTCYSALKGPNAWQTHRDNARHGSPVPTKGYSTISFAQHSKTSIDLFMCDYGLVSWSDLVNPTPAHLEGGKIQCMGRFPDSMTMILD